jgi:hypothetical protein
MWSKNTFERLELEYEDSCLRIKTYGGKSRGKRRDKVLISHCNIRIQLCLSSLLNYLLSFEVLNCPAISYLRKLLELRRRERERERRYALFFTNGEIPIYLRMFL